MKQPLSEIRTRAAAASPLWAAALLPGEPPQPRFSGRCPERYLLGVEMIHEAYLLHYGTSRLFSQNDRDLALLTGDWLYAAGLAEICTTGDLAAVDALADLIARCAANRGGAEPVPDDPLWDATVAGLGAAT